MSEEAAPEGLAVIWSPEARTDLRAIDCETAMQILYSVDRCGDYRVFFDPKGDTTIAITAVRNRREAYR